MLMKEFRVRIPQFIATRHLSNRIYGVTFQGHRDGIWDICVSKLGNPLIGTASADKTARIWGVDSGRCLTGKRIFFLRTICPSELIPFFKKNIAYTGHSGSVNSFAFHPTQDLVRQICLFIFIFSYPFLFCRP